MSGCYTVFRATGKIRTTTWSRGCGVLFMGCEPAYSHLWPTLLEGHLSTRNTYSHPWEKLEHVLGLMSLCVLLSCFRRSFPIPQATRTSFTVSREVSISALAAMTYARGGPLSGTSAEAHLRRLNLSTSRPFQVIIGVL